MIHFCEIYTHILFNDQNNKFLGTLYNFFFVF